MEPGKRIEEHYVLIEQIGQGGQAVVWSADDERLKRVVAVKAISLHPAEDESQSESATEPNSMALARRFQDEAHIIASLEHPGILPIYTYGQESDNLYIVMRYMAGGSLRHLLQNGPMALAQVVRSGRILADALDLAHQNQIVHRDIKSANVLLDARNNLYLADFGLSITVGDTTSSGAGTLAYMSPEQMSGDPVDQRSDLYAFGILLFEMLTGVIPRIDNQTWNYMQLVSNVPMPIPDSIPREVGAVLIKATAVKPEDRYQSAAAIIDALSDAAHLGGSSSGGGMSLDTDFLMPVGLDLSLLPTSTDPATLAVLTANSMFDAALSEWADGAGRFRFYEDDFQYVASFYADADSWGITLDRSAHRLMLRAALEYGYQLEHWWAALDDDGERRGIALQTLTSERAPARMRALEFLATVGDTEPPAMPTRVAAILSREPDAKVRAAGIALLEKQATPTKAWRPVAFNETVDTALAEIAAHDPDRRVAEAAARVCGRIYSSLAVTRLGQLAAGDDARALQALTCVRDEAPALPSEIPAVVRRRVFVALSVRQLLASGLVGRYLGAAVGFFIPWVVVQYLQYTGNELLGSQAVGNALASGALYSLPVALSVLFATEPADRLRVWRRWARIGLSWAFGALFCAAAFLTIRRFYYFNADPPDLPWILIASAIFPAGFAIASGLTRRAWIRSAAGMVGVLVGIYLSWSMYASGQAQDFMIFFDPPEQALLRSIYFAVALGACTFLPEALKAFRQLARGVM